MNALPPAIPQKRPILVWVFSLWNFLALGLTILLLILLYSGVIKAKESQKAIIHSRTALAYGVYFLHGSLNLAGAVSLFLLRKPAFYFFVTAFCIGIGQMVYEIIEMHGLRGNALSTTIVNWLINIVIIVYSKRLINRGILK